MLESMDGPTSQSASPSQVLRLQHCATLLQVMLHAHDYFQGEQFRGRDSHIVLTLLHPHQVRVIQSHTHRYYTNCSSQILGLSTSSALWLHSSDHSQDSHPVHSHSIINQSLAS